MPRGLPGHALHYGQKCLWRKGHKLNVFPSKKKKEKDRKRKSKAKDRSHSGYMDFQEEICSHFVLMKPVNFPDFGSARKFLGIKFLVKSFSYALCPHPQRFLRIRNELRTSPRSDEILIHRITIKHTSNLILFSMIVPIRIVIHSLVCI